MYTPNIYPGILVLAVWYELDGCKLVNQMVGKKKIMTNKTDVLISIFWMVNHQESNIENSSTHKHIYVYLYTQIYGHNILKPDYS